MVSPTSNETIDCGALARSHFLFDQGYLNLNHGSFGAIPRDVRDVQRHYQDVCESRPDVFIRYEFPSLLSASRSAIASYLGGPKSSIVYVANATTALNTVLRNLSFTSNDVCVYFSTIYGSIEKTLLYLAETTPLRLLRIPLVYPLTDAIILDTFHNALTEIRGQGLHPKMAIYDTVSSLPGVRFPFEAMTSLCRQEGVLSCIDAAHCAGHLPINLSDLDPDFFVTNLHKWLHVPRPCAILYVPQRHQALMRSSLPTSHGFVPKGMEGTINNPLPSTGEPLSEFEVNFEFVGTLDTSAYICVAAALHWRSQLRWQGRSGEDAIMAYCTDQAREAGRVVAEALQTDVLENKDGSLGKCCFSNVRLPLDYDALVGGGDIHWDKVVEIARWIEEVLVRDHGTFVAVIFHARAWYIRLSAQVYLTLDDWKRAGGWLKSVCDRAKEKKWAE